MHINIDLLNELRQKYGDSFYLLDSRHFEENYQELVSALQKHYPKSSIAYSYKTNYTPFLLKLVNKLGGYAEVVSSMEYELALKIGVQPEKIIFNGPYKHSNAIEKLLLDGGTVHLDSWHELPYLKSLARENPDKVLHIGIRCNFDLEDGKVSRFGFDVENGSFNNLLAELSSFDNIRIKGMHCHYPTRSLSSFKKRAQKMLGIIDTYFKQVPSYISLGGGLFGKMGPELREQFDCEVPEYEDYGAVIAGALQEKYGNLNLDMQPQLLIEPGSALVADTMKFVATVIEVKAIRGKNIATVSGSMYNINPTSNGKNLPMTILSPDNNLVDRPIYKDVDFGGYTCIESDFLYKGYTGAVSVGDFVIFDNVGSYSVVLKPPFILPNFPVLEYSGDQVILIKRQEKMEDIFATFEF